MLKRTSSRNVARGVTLIELAVTLVILGLLLVATMPSMSAWLRNTQVRNTASAMLAGLQVARNEAIRRNAAIRFSIVSLTNSAVMSNTCALSGSGVSWVVSVRDPAANCHYAPANTAADANDPMIVEKSAGGVGGRNVVVAAKLADGSAAADTVVFNGFGRVDNATPIGFINVQNETTGNDYRRFRIEIAPGGAVRMCDLDVSAPNDSRHCATWGTP